MNKEQLNKKDVLFMKVNWEEIFLNNYFNFLIKLVCLFLARKYAALKKTRHYRAGKQQSIDEDEEDIGI